MSRKIIDKNLEIMLSTLKGGMRFAIPESTIYGSGKAHQGIKNISCAFNPETGEIGGFYLGTIPKELKTSYLSHGNVILADSDPIYSALIVDYDFCQDRLDFMDKLQELTAPNVQAGQILEETVNEYNHMIPHIGRVENALNEHLKLYYETLYGPKPSFLERIRQRLRL